MSKKKHNWPTKSKSVDDDLAAKIRGLVDACTHLTPRREAEIDRQFNESIFVPTDDQVAARNSPSFTSLTSDTSDWMRIAEPSAEDLQAIENEGF